MTDDEILRQYLLGALDEEQTDVVEERLLKDSNFFELAEAVEGDLLLAAARGELAPATRGRVLRRLARSPEGRARYHISRELVAISREPVPAGVRIFQLASQPWVRAAVAAAGVAFVVIGLRLGTTPDDYFNRLANSMRPPAPSPDTTAPTPSEDQFADNTPAPGTPFPEEKPVVEPAAPPKPAAWVFQLALSQLRGAGEGSPVMKIPPGTQQVEIQLPLHPDEPVTRMTVTLKSVSPEEVVQRDWRSAPRDVNGQKMVVLTVPVNELTPGTYEIEVLGPAPEEDLLGRPTFEVASN